MIWTKALLSFVLRPVVSQSKFSHVFLEPGPPAVFDFDGVYDVELHVYWKAPCQANGVIIEYILTVSNERKQIQERKLGENVRTYKVSGLARVTDYKLELVARTSGGRGIAKVLETRTKPAAGLSVTLLHISFHWPRCLRLNTSCYFSVTISAQDYARDCSIQCSHAHVDQWSPWQLTYHEIYHRIPNLNR